MRSIFSPYRICPIGAHIDHQGGVVLGRTIRLGTLLEYEPLSTNEIQLASAVLGQARFAIGELDHGHWARYAQAAARVLDAQQGMRAQVQGDLIGAGLSSSASVGLAYLQALAEVNGRKLAPGELVELGYRLEFEELGLQIGLLDPLTIVHGRRSALLFMDPVAGTVTPIPDPPAGGFGWIVAYSGVSRELTRSGFNARVSECYQAAAALQAGAQKLGDVPRNVFEDRKSSLPENLRKRAEHFYTEVERVRRGAQVWRAGDLAAFGQLMNQSCYSSINNYQSGSELLVELHELVSGTMGVYGSRFSGGGYGGCVVALAERQRAESACTEILDSFCSHHPELPARVFVVEPGDGLAHLKPTVSAALYSLRSRSGRPRAAILLAAGRGKRLRPYTDRLPKPLLEVDGRATLDYILVAAARAGLERVCFVTHHREAQIFEYVGDGSRWGLAVTFAHQNELRGNGDALLAVPEDWIPDEAVLVTATDYVLDQDALQDLVDWHLAQAAAITVSLKESPAGEQSARSTVQVDADWRIRRILEKPRLEQVLGPYAASALFILPPAAWAYVRRLELSPRGELELQSAVDAMIQDGYPAYGLLQPAPREWAPAADIQVNQG